MPLKKLREDRGLTQKNLALLMEEKGYSVTWRTIQNWESSPANVAYKALTVLAEVFETSALRIVSLIERSEQDTKIILSDYTDRCSDFVEQLTLRGVDKELVEKAETLLSEGKLFEKRYYHLKEFNP